MTKVTGGHSSADHLPEELAPGDGTGLRRAAAFFDALAEGYDAEGVHARIAEALVAFAQLPTGPGLVIDVATGAGAAAFAAVEAADAQQVLAIDVSAQMLALGQARAQASTACRRVRWVRAGALPLPVADEVAEVVLCASSAHFLGAQALADWRRVLRSGGHLGFTLPSAASFRPLPAARQVMPAGGADLVGSIEHAMAAAARAGFTDVRATSVVVDGAQRREVVIVAARKP